MLMWQAFTSSYPKKSSCNMLSFASSGTSSIVLEEIDHVLPTSFMSTGGEGLREEDREIFISRISFI